MQCRLVGHHLLGQLREVGDAGVIFPRLHGHLGYLSPINFEMEAGVA